MNGKKGIRIQVHGIVQGVGFRPFLHRLAEKHRISGWVRNTAFGVEIEAEGFPSDLALFQKELETTSPPLAAVEFLRTTPKKQLSGYRDFSIRSSETGSGSTLISPDIAVCDSCLSELQTPGDRRYRYPFINCTDCGPRFTIIRDLPYDRERTSMSQFSMCPECEKEFHDITSRRYHAQPDCCAVCGPQVFYQDNPQLQANESRDFIFQTQKDNLAACGQQMSSPSSSQNQENKSEDPFFKAQLALAQGKIIAVKGIGGIHLACDAANPQAVNTLRLRKNRPDKPLAVMCRDLSAVRKFCRCTLEEETFLRSPRRPIVLLEKKEPGSFSFLSDNRRLGIMLPYSPLHVLLLDGSFGGPDALVMTSANLSGRPVITENGQALQDLREIADGFLLHNRPIQNRCDDSLLSVWRGGEYFFRRSRGYAPQPIACSFDATGVVAFGAEQKASFAVGREHHGFPSQYIGDLKNPETLDHYRQSLSAYLKLFHITPSHLVCDLHPDYFSTREAVKYSETLGLPIRQVQHHWAHMASCMADNSLTDPAFGVIWDGTGLGTDRTIWGGEFLQGDFHSFQRLGSIRPILLLGGDKAVKEPGRVALSLLLDAGLPTDKLPYSAKEKDVLQAMWEKRLNCPAASSIGRLFDGVFALLTGKNHVTYEGQGAVLLEAMADFGESDEAYPLAFYGEKGVRFFDTRPLMQAIFQELESGIPVGSIARKFMNTLCFMALDQCRVLNSRRYPVVFSGGVFLNQYLLQECSRRFEKAGYSAFFHHRVSASDEGISLGQLAIAAHEREVLPCV